MLSALIDRMDRLEALITMADQLPGMMAMFVDTMDELARQAADNGVDLDQIITHGLPALIKFIGLVSSDSFDALLDSGVFDPRAVGVVGAAGEALVKCESEVRAAPDAVKVGPMGMVRAMKDPDVQRALGFLVTFGRHFGNGVGKNGAN